MKSNIKSGFIVGAFAMATILFFSMIFGCAHLQTQCARKTRDFVYKCLESEDANVCIDKAAVVLDECEIYEMEKAHAQAGVSID